VNCCWLSLAQSILVTDPVGIITIFFCFATLRDVCLLLLGNGSVNMFPWQQIHTQQFSVQSLSQCAAGILSREDVCAECARHLAEASVIPGSRDMLTSEGSRQKFLSRSTVSADGPGRPVRFEAHRQPLRWNFLYHSRIVLSVGVSVWCLVRNVRWTVTTDSILANSKTERFFIPYTRHVSSRLLSWGAYYPNKLGEILCLLICSFLLCLS
jgi:hypothetical protein